MILLSALLKSTREASVRNKPTASAAAAEAAPTNGGGELDPLAFWKELQSQHRAEAEKLTGVEGVGGDGGGGGNRRQRGVGKKK